MLAPLTAIYTNGPDLRFCFPEFVLLLRIICCVYHLIQLLLITFVAGPKECEDITATDDGVYTIYPKPCDEPVLAYCIMEQNKKWTVSIDYF